MHTWTLEEIKNIIQLYTIRWSGGGKLIFNEANLLLNTNQKLILTFSLYHSSELVEEEYEKRIMINGRFSTLIRNYLSIF